MNRGIKLLLSVPLITNIIRKFMRKWQIMESRCINLLDSRCDINNDSSGKGKGGVRRVSQQSLFSSLF